MRRVDTKADVRGRDRERGVRAGRRAMVSPVHFLEQLSPTENRRQSRNEEQMLLEFVKVPETAIVFARDLVELPDTSILFANYILVFG